MVGVVVIGWWMSVVGKWIFDKRKFFGQKSFLVKRGNLVGEDCAIFWVCGCVVRLGVVV